VFSNYAAGNGHNASSNPNGERHTIDIKDFTNILRLAKLVGGGGQSAQRSAAQRSTASWRSLERSAVTAIGAKI